MSSLAQEFDCLLLDLDGTVFRGHEPTDGAVDTLAAVEARKFFVTNNASRGPGEVADHLRSMGFRVLPGDVVTSAQGAARLLSDQLSPGSKVLVIGTDALADEVVTAGLVAVRTWADEPVAVVQGHSPNTGWANLAEAALAIRGGALWVASNVDLTLPSERGLLPGNGSMVAALRAATEREPQVAGKPQPTLMRDALSRGHFDSPLVVGDRLDTDIAGAVAAQLPSLLVLSGVSTADDAIRAVPAQRATYIGEDLRALMVDSDPLLVAPHPAWDVEVDGSRVMVRATGADPGDDLSVVRATARAVWDARIWAGEVWDAETDGRPLELAADDAARHALQRWSVSTAAIG